MCKVSAQESADNMRTMDFTFKKHFEVNNCACVHYLLYYSQIVKQHHYFHNASDNPEDLTGLD